MPSTSKRQHNAMEAAAHGHSTIGIPRSVGKEFVKADHVKPRGSTKSNPGYHGNLDAGKSAPVTHAVSQPRTIQKTVPPSSACNHGGFDTMQTYSPPTRTHEDRR